jgi:ribosomal-protein-alanine N-acetyltransferase
MIRAAAPKDIPALARMHAASFCESWDEKSLRDLLESPGIFAFVALCGFVMARVAADEAEILTLAVEPAARRTGLGRALVVRAAERANADGARTMFLEVAVGNRAARALYDRLGFREAGRRKAYYAASEDALILRVDLPLRPLGIPKTSTKVEPQLPGNDRDAD